GFVDENRRVLEREILPATRGVAAAGGFVDADRDRPSPPGGPPLYNPAASPGGRGPVRGAPQSPLPGDHVFFERPRFPPAPGAAPERAPQRVAGTTVGVEVCEDMWDDAYECKVSRILARQGAGLLANLSSSPFHAGKGEERLAVARSRARETGLPFLYVNGV